ncbi:STAS/SEC14 domain-containing protein [Rhodopirellula sp. P2]|uniref:STAS/SEC14 domain-containing protein n=1 Tax=Rhodopirellula sp. P2 TaxID=2127060 RepID=UPI002368819B|nr:STAS/SEC14 domain-containing protein [Rhodopirellula sp. P2]WDQ18546.1 STAS/SEC14 domain-containing protein [Rhodopirellula sp. P2]
MAVQIIQDPATNMIEIQASGLLTTEDYETFLPRVEKAIEEHGKLNLMFVMEHVDGWEVGAFWEDLKFGFKHHGELNRIAIVGDKKWEIAMAKIGQYFTSAEVKFFSVSDQHHAIDWFRVGGTSPAKA